MTKAEIVTSISEKTGIEKGDVLNSRSLNGRN